MRTWTALGIALAISACKGGDDGTATDTAAPAETCEDEGVTPLPNLSSDQWPGGISEALGVYDDLPGRFTADQCLGGTATLKVVWPDQESLQVITGPLGEGTVCGCPSDPKYQHDNAYAPVGHLSGGTIFIDGDDAFPYAEVDAQIVDLEWTVFPSAAPFQFRACTTVPILGTLSPWESYTVIVRRYFDGTYDADVVMAADTDSDQCELSNWVYVGTAE